MQEKERQIRISRNFIENRKKWEENVIKKVDLLPAEPETHFNGRVVKPGFLFWLSLCSAPKFMLAKLDINVPDMIYVNYNAYIVSSHPDGGSLIKIEQSSDPTKVLAQMKERESEFYNPAKYWNQPAAVMKKTSKHTCYTMSELLDWR